VTMTASVMDPLRRSPDQVSVSVCLIESSPTPREDHW
jgi:hypothetical protein